MHLERVEFLALLKSASRANPVKIKRSDWAWKPLIPAMAGGLIAIVIIAFLFHGRDTHKVQTQIVRLSIVTWPGYGPIYLGQAKGFFSEEGIEVDCRIQENTQARHAALVAGEIDL